MKRKSKVKSLWQVGCRLAQKHGPGLLIYQQGAPLRYALPSSQHLTDGDRVLLASLPDGQQVLTTPVSGQVWETLIFGQGDAAARLRVVCDLKKPLRHIEVLSN